MSRHDTTFLFILFLFAAAYGLWKGGRHAAWPGDVLRTFVEALLIVCATTGLLIVGQIATAALSGTRSIPAREFAWALVYLWMWIVLIGVWGSLPLLAGSTLGVILRRRWRTR